MDIIVSALPVLFLLLNILGGKVTRSVLLTFGITTIVTIIIIIIFFYQYSYFFSLFLFFFFLIFFPY